MASIQSLYVATAKDVDTYWRPAGAVRDEESGCGITFGVPSVVTPVASLKDMRVLVSAYFCDPEDGSEPGVGWAFASAAAVEHDVWLLTHERFQERISTALAGRPELKLEPVYLTAAPLEDRFGRLSYHWWQRRARSAVRELHDEVRFDLTHHVTVSAAYMYSALSELAEVPLVWGPVSSVPTPPARLWRYMGPRGMAEEAVRSIVTAAGRACYGRPMARRAALVISAEDEGPHRLARPDAIVEPNTAISPAPDPAPSPAGNVDASERRTAMFAGRLIYVKGLRIAIRALARDAAKDWDFHVYGDGPEEMKLRNLATSLGVDERVIFHGRQPRSDVFDALQRADAFLMPSLHDGTSWAIAEALAVGCPVVCLDWGGPRTLVRLVGGRGVSVRGDVEQNVAEALAEITTRNEPTDRFSTERLPAIVDSWYRAASSGSGSG